MLEIVTEPDIASLLQAKAAIAAGILTLLRRVDMRPQDVKTLYLAGGVLESSQDGAQRRDELTEAATRGGRGLVEARVVVEVIYR